MESPVSVGSVVVPELAIIQFFTTVAIQNTLIRLSLNSGRLQLGT